MKCHFYSAFNPRKKSQFEGLLSWQISKLATMLRRLHIVLENKKKIKKKRTRFNVLRHTGYMLLPTFIQTNCHRIGDVVKFAAFKFQVLFQCHFYVGLVWKIWLLMKKETPSTLEISRQLCYSLHFHYYNHVPCHMAQVSMALQRSQSLVFWAYLGATKLRFL